ncbi:MAG: histidinol-phosphatase [Acidimicrobiia bacterium]|nr:histidinol-phosphatase [Acidimicrobiia bacterium]
MTVDSYLALALDLVDLADEITMRLFRATDLVVSTKPDNTPVTEADHAVEQAIREHLAIYAKEHAILGEEFGYDETDDSEYRWIIDPIDGTKSYLRGVPIWATLVGLEWGGEMVVGVVSAPALHTRWWAGRGLGAFRDGDPIHVSAVEAIEDAHISFSWDTTERFEHGRFDTNVMALARRCWRSRSLGDFWQHVLVAEGALDAAAEPVISPWDVAALQPIIEEAGGRFSDLSGAARIDGGSIVCTNGRLHEAVLSALAPGAGARPQAAPD